VPSPTPTFEAPFNLGAQIEARATHPETADRPFLLQGERTWTYRRYRDECVRLAHFLRRRLGPVDDARPGHVAMLLENHLELLALYGACGYAGFTLFGVNTGLRGATLAGVLDQSRARVLVVQQRLAGEVERVRGQLRHLAPENVLVLRTEAGEPVEGHDLAACLEREVGTAGASLDAPPPEVPATTPLMVIYTSGTTGLPKGIINNHAKLLVIGMAVSSNLGLGPDDVGYACMPLFHSNAMFLGFQPAFHVGGALSLRERFSATSFVPDVFRYGATYWNYVGEPVHYVLAALRPTSSASSAGSGSKTCSSCTARPRPPSAPSAARATRAAASARSPTPT
jgi:fatty-acyl-CoA synthase